MVAAPFVRVHALPTGYLWLPDRWIFADGDTNLRHLSPDYSFLISHPSGKNVLFDLGMRKVGHFSGSAFLEILLIKIGASNRTSIGIQG
jgi:hypothetical protein